MHGLMGDETKTMKKDKTGKIITGADDEPPKSQAFAPAYVFAGAWTDFCQKSYVLEERAETYAAAFSFPARSPTSQVGRAYRRELQESTAKSIGVLWMILPAGAVVMKVSIMADGTLRTWRGTFFEIVDTLRTWRGTPRYSLPGQGL